MLLLKIFFILINILIFYHHKAKAKLFPVNFIDSELYLPNKWTSVNDCPVRYYDVARSSIISAAAAQTAYNRELAHIAAIGWSEEEGQVKWNCEGTLISENYIVTAGHCAIWKGKKPDLARMGDLYLQNDTDDKWVQELKVEKVVRHPLYSEESSYYDIALIKLNGSIKVHDTVCPACLWINNTISFRFFEALGLNHLNSLVENAPKHSSITLSPVSNEDCSNHFSINLGITEGLKDHQMCVVDRNNGTNICIGDSGGPLQMKLLGHGRMHPFIIGVTSFGKSCGTDPIIYTRISSFVDWIESVTNIDTDPRRCAMKYQGHREFEPDVIIGKDDDTEFFTYSNLHIDTYSGSITYMVEFGSCTGALITEKFVLTLASCLTSLSKPYPEVKTRDGTEFKIKTVTVHPRFEIGSINDDIALVELVTEVKLSRDVHPACLFSKSQIPQEHEFGLVGWGLVEGKNNDSLHLVSSRLKPMNYTYCNQFYETDGIKVDEETKICYGNTDYYLVPDTCQLAPGAPIERESFASDRFYSYIIGLPVTANDCGYGFPAVAAKISYYIDWIDSIIFPEKDEEVVSNEPKPSHVNMNYIKECPNLYKEYKRNAIERYEETFGDEFAHLALIGYSQTLDWHCRGNLISDKHVLTSNECVNQESKYDTVALGNINRVLYGIAKIVTNDRTLTLLTLDTVVSFSKDIFPICLWTDKTKVPFQTSFIVSQVNSPLVSASVRPYQTTNCKTMKVASSIKFDDQSCVKFILDLLCTSPGTGIHFIRNVTGLFTRYLVGQLDDVGFSGCDPKDKDAQFAFTKISSNIEWISSNM